eukprot:1273270-Amphidinium_carterae.2
MTYVKGFMASYPTQTGYLNRAKSGGPLQSHQLTSKGFINLGQHGSHSNFPLDCNATMLLASGVLSCHHCRVCFERALYVRPPDIVDVCDLQGSSVAVAEVSEEKAEGLAILYEISKLLNTGLNKDRMLRKIFAQHRQGSQQKAIESTV